MMVVFLARTEEDMRPTVDNPKLHSQANLIKKHRDQPVLFISALGLNTGTNQKKQFL